MFEKEFDINDIILFPLNIKKEIDNYFVILAPDYPNWIVLDNIEFLLFEQLEKKKTIMESMDYICDLLQPIEEELVIEKMTNLLTKVEETLFYKDTPILEERSIKEIKKGIQINLTNNCNLRCSHCYMSAGMSLEQKLDLEKILKTVTDINDKIGFTDITISGGEPLVYPNIIDFLRKLSNNNITLFTNATLITENNYSLLCEYCNEIQVSLEGLTKESYESVRGKGNFSKVINAIDLIKRKKVRLVLAITLLPNNLKNIEDNLIDFINKLSYDNLEIRLNSEIEFSGNALNLDFSNYNKEEVDDIVIRLMKQLKEMGISIKYKSGRNKHFSNCGIGANFVINYDGNIYPCTKFSDIKKNISDSIDDIIDEFDLINIKTSVNFIEKCKMCELKYICTGGCRINNYLINKSMTEPVCNESYKEEQYRRLLYEYLRG